MEKSAAHQDITLLFQNSDKEFSGCLQDKKVVFTGQFAFVKTADIENFFKDNCKASVSKYFPPFATFIIVHFSVFSL